MTTTAMLPNSCCATWIETTASFQTHPLKKTLKQRLIRVKENIIRALNKEKWKEQQRLKEMQGKEIVRFM